MDRAVLLAVIASFCTATSSVCQRLGAKDEGTGGFDAGLLLRLVRHPVWLLGLGSMILGFVFQLGALHYGDLALVQPILATELLFVFAYMSVIGGRRVVRRDWLAAAAMAAGLGLFLFVASPHGGRLHASGSTWWLAGGVSLAVVAVVIAAAGGSRAPHGSSSRRAALLGVATGLAWGFVAAVIKELSSHLGGGVGAVASNWSVYVLVVAGAASVLLASHALAAGSLAASQPGFTIVDPLAASLLGLFVFGEHIDVGVANVVGEGLALALLVAGVTALSHSQLVVGDAAPLDRPQSGRAGRVGPHPVGGGAGSVPSLPTHACSGLPSGGDPAVGPDGGGPEWRVPGCPLPPGGIPPH
jgi:drug/metabolite transporter (DMT)-like permease